MTEYLLFVLFLAPHHHLSFDLFIPFKELPFDLLHDADG